MADRIARRNIEVPSLEGQTWLVTGCTHGVGLATVRAASLAGARVILAVRNLDLGQEVAASLPGPTRVIGLDLASLDSVRRAAAEVDEDVDVLINNAGAITSSRTETEDGFESLIGVNLLGPFLFTELVLPRVRRRIVIVGSNAHHGGTLDLDDPHFRSRRWTSLGAYAQSKLGDMLWGLALDRRLADSGSTVDVQITHPGWAATNITNSTPSPILNRIITAASSAIGQPAEQAALTSLYAATRDLPRCSYVGPDRMWHMRGTPTLMGRSAAASDPELAERLWSFTQHEIGLDQRHFVKE